VHVRVCVHVRVFVHVRVRVCAWGTAAKRSLGSLGRGTTPQVRVAS
jgi:hypothetical protein